MICSNQIIINGLQEQKKQETMALLRNAELPRNIFFSIKKPLNTNSLIYQWPRKEGGKRMGCTS